MKTRTSHKRMTFPRRFDALCAQHALRPIQDNVDLENAREIVDVLAVLPRRTKDQEDYLQTLSTLIEKYEADQDAMEVSNLNPIETLRYLMEGRDMSASDLGRVLGNRELGAAILRGDRKLSKSNILKLGKHFAVSPALFLD